MQELCPWETFIFLLWLKFGIFFSFWAPHSHPWRNLARRSRSYIHSTLAISTLAPFRLTHTHTHTHTRLTALFPGLPGWAGTRKVKPIWILLKQETVSGSGIIWATCKSAPRSRQITMPAPHHSVFYRPDALPAAQPTASKHWLTQCVKRHNILQCPIQWRSCSQPMKCQSRHRVDHHCSC